MSRGRNDNSLNVRVLEPEAAEYARLAHRSQRHGARPYYKHLEEVVAVLTRFNHTDPDLIRAAWLHDTVEDTQITLDNLTPRFGERAAFLVDCVTQRDGINRKARIAATYEFTRRDSLAVALKLADRIANVENSLKDPADKGFVKMYKKEHPGFYAALHRKGEHDKMWQHLNGLLDFNPPPSKQV